MAKNDIDFIGMGYGLEVPSETVSACSRCILGMHRCPGVACGGMSITDPKKLGVQLLLNTIDINEAHT